MIEIISYTVKSRHNHKEDYRIDYIVIHYTMPTKPLNAKAINAAVTKAIGLPFHEGNVSALSNLSRKQENRYNTSINPKGYAIELTIVSTRL